jgi:hypothetical protein
MALVAKMSQAVRDFVWAPLRLTVLSDEQCARLGLTSINRQRIDFALGYCRGALLDIGSGNNGLVRRHRGSGIGVDVFDWKSGAIVLEDPSMLPFGDGDVGARLPDRMIEFDWRYRLPCLPVLILLGAIGWHQLVREFAIRQQSRLPPSQVSADHVSRQG